MAVALPVPTARHIRKELRLMRREHADLSVWEVLEKAYMWLIGLAVIGSMTGAAVARVADEVVSCGANACAVARGPMPVVVTLLLAGVLLRGLTAVGPVVATHADQAWLLSTPVERGGLLRGRYVLAVLAGCGPAAVVLVLASTVAGADGVGIGTAALAGVALAVAAAGLTTMAQPRPALRAFVTRAGDVLMLATLPILIAVVSGHPIGGSGWLDSSAVAAGAAALLVAAVLLVAVGGSRLARLTLPEMVAGGELLLGLAGAASAMDIALIGEIVQARKFRLLGARPSRRGRGTGPSALLDRELRRLLRSPGRLVAFVALCIIPPVLHQAGLVSVVPIISGLIGYLAVRWAASGLRRAWRSDGLRRSLPFPAGTLIYCLGGPASLLAIVWAVVASFSTELPPPLAVIAVAAAIIAGVLRSACAKPPNYNGPLVTSPMGAIPPGMVSALVRGPDFALAGTVLLALHVPTFLQLIVPLILLGIAVMMAGRAASSGDREPLATRLAKAQEEAKKARA